MNETVGSAQAAVKPRRKATRVFLVLFLVLALLITACVVYLSSYYRADSASIDAFSAGIHVEETVLDNGDLVFGSGEEDCGLIFYPGGKVSHEAYVPLMRELAFKGIFCVICEMPFRLAVLDASAADGVQEKYPEVRHWYLGGHSLGGVIAASYAADHKDEFEGLILLASYSTSDLSGSGLAVLSVCGSEDGVLDMKSYEKKKSNLPDDARVTVIEGGCHAGFGMYGAQRGDGIPTISTEEQIRMTASAILALMNGEEAILCRG